METQARYDTKPIEQAAPSDADRLANGDPLTWAGQIFYTDRDGDEHQIYAERSIMREVAEQIASVLRSGKSYTVYFDKETIEPPKGSFEWVDRRRKIQVRIRIQQQKTEYIPTQVYRPAIPDYATMSSKGLVLTAWGELKRRAWKQFWLVYWRARRPADTWVYRTRQQLRWSRLAGWWRDHWMRIRRFYNDKKEDAQFFFRYRALVLRIWYRSQQRNLRNKLRNWLNGRKQ